MPKPKCNRENMGGRKIKYGGRRKYWWTKKTITNVRFLHAQEAQLVKGQQNKIRHYYKAHKKKKIKIRKIC